GDREAQGAGGMEAMNMTVSWVKPERCEEVHGAVGEFGLAFLPYRPLGQGVRTGRYGPGSKFAGTDLRARSERFSPDGLEACEPLIARVKSVAGRRGRTPAQVAIRWLLEDPAVTSVIAGVKRPAQIEDNV